MHLTSSSTLKLALFQVRLVWSRFPTWATDRCECECRTSWEAHFAQHISYRLLRLAASSTQPAVQGLRGCFLASAQDPSDSAARREWNEFCFLRAVGRVVGPLVRGQLRLASSHPDAGHRAGVKPDACPESGPALCPCAVVQKQMPPSGFVFWAGRHSRSGNCRCGGLAASTSQMRSGRRERTRWCQVPPPLRSLPPLRA